MCHGNLSTFPSCGHRRKLQPSHLCPCYSLTQNRCNGTVPALQTNTTDSPALCMRCASRIEANIIRERDLITAELEKNIAEINHGLWLERSRAFNYIALIFERARLREALKGFWEKREEELEELREMQGMGRWDRVDVLRG